MSDDNPQSLSGLDLMYVCGFLDGALRGAKEVSVEEIYDSAKMVCRVEWREDASQTMSAGERRMLLVADRPNNGWTGAEIRKLSRIMADTFERQIRQFDMRRLGGRPPLG